MEYLLAIIFATLYVAFTLANWRIAKFFCMKSKWLLLLPVVNVIYFSRMSDTVAVESHDTSVSYSCQLMCVLIPMMFISYGMTMFKQYEYIMLAGRIGVILSAIFCVLVFFWSYMLILSNSFEYPTLVCLASLIIPFPIFLLIASFTVQEKMQEVIEIYLG